MSSSCTKRDCSGFGFWDNEDFAVDATSAPALFKLQNQMRKELEDSQRKFAADMEKRLKQALTADRSLAVAKAKRANSGPNFEISSTIQNVWQKMGETQMEFTSMRKDTYASVPQMGTLELVPWDEPGSRQHSELQVKWVEDWMELTEAGELDVYTCLGLSNCFSWTPDTRRIFAKAVAVTFLQMVVPFCLLLSEFEVGIELGPAEGGLAFRITGFTLYGYAVYNMYHGANDACRTQLLNLAFHYHDMPAGNWLPLLFGEISNVFTAVVLVVALYSIFTTQVAPADLILNAVAVNFLGDCDGAFVNEEMQAEAKASFEELTTALFSDPNNKHVDDPAFETLPAKFVRYALYVIAVAGAAGCLMFLLHPMHEDGMRDTIPGYGHKALMFNKTMHNRSK